METVMLYEGSTYCSNCAEEVWDEEATEAIQSNHPRNAQQYISQMYLPEEAEDHEIDDGGAMCQRCEETLVGRLVTCDACGEHAREGSSDYANLFEEAVDEGHTFEGDYGGLMTTWCEECRSDNHPDEGGETLIYDDGRGYTLRFLADYTGQIAHSTWRQAVGDIYTDTADVYAAGCRRFPLAIALQHWGNPDHYSNVRHREILRHRQAYPDLHEGAPEAISSADVLFRAVLAHAMRRALPNLRNRLVDPTTEGDC